MDDNRLTKNKTEKKKKKKYPTYIHFPLIQHIEIVPFISFKK